MDCTEEEKNIIVARFQQGVPASTLCAEYGFSRSTLYRWSKIYCIANPSQERTFTIRDYDMLQYQVEKQASIIAVLKSVHCTVFDSLKEKLFELEQLYGQYDVHTLCEALEGSRGAFYNHVLRNKGDSAWFENRREEYRILIRDEFDKYRQVLGAQKNLRDLGTTRPSGQPRICCQAHARDGGFPASARLPNRTT